MILDGNRTMCIERNEPLADELPERFDRPRQFIIGLGRQPGNDKLVFDRRLRMFRTLLPRLPARHHLHLTIEQQLQQITDKTEICPQPTDVQQQRSRLPNVGILLLLYVVMKITFQ